MQKARISMILAGGTLLTLIVSTNSLPGAKSVVHHGDGKQIALSIADTASKPAGTDLAPLSTIPERPAPSAAFASLLPQTLAQATMETPAVKFAAPLASKPGIFTAGTSLFRGLIMTPTTVAPAKAGSPTTPGVAPAATTTVTTLVGTPGTDPQAGTPGDPTAQLPVVEETTTTTAAPAVTPTTAVPAATTTTFAPTTTTTAAPTTTITTAPPATTTTTVVVPSTTTTTKPLTQACKDAQTVLAKDQATLAKDLANGAKADVIKHDQDRVAADQKVVDQKCV